VTLDLDPTLLAVLAIAATVLALIGLLLGLVALLRVRRVRRDLVLLQGDDTGDTFVAAVGRQVEAVEQLRSEVVAAQRDIRGLRVDLTEAVRHVAVVRYDAFNDMGGRMSFSVAFLDDSGDGVVLTSINGRTETRTYAKSVLAGSSEALLSPEEQEVVSYALRARV
jgi:hypothetical protein